MSRMRKKRITIGTFDLVKGIGILFIIAGHTLAIYGESLKRISPVFSVFGWGVLPMFYIISGLGSKKMDIKKHLKRTVKDLLFPYLWVVAFVAILFPIFHYIAFRWWPGAFLEMRRTTLGLLTGCKISGKQICGIEVYESSAVWYLLALFIALNTMNIIWKISNKWETLFLVCLCIVAGFWCKTADIWYYCIPYGLMAVGYVYLGGFIKKSRWLEKDVPLWQFVVLGVVFLASEILEHSSAIPSMEKEILDYIGTGSLGIFFVRFAIWADRFEGVIFDGIRKIGRYSYYIMCIHSVEMSCIPWYLFAQKFSTHPYLGFFLQMVLRGIIIGLGCMCLTRIMKYRHQKRMKKSNVSY